MSPNRIVALLTPVFAGLAGYVAQFIAREFPGTPALDEGELTAIFIAGATAGLAAAIAWIQGWQKHEERVASRSRKQRAPASERVPVSGE